MAKIINNLLSTLVQNNIPLNWNTILVGMQLDFLDNNDAIDYLVAHPSENNKTIIALAVAEPTDENIQDLLNKIIKLKMKTTNKSSEKGKWRYAFLNHLYSKYQGKNTLKDTQSLINEIDIAYADFHYPEDMAHFISYMPATDNAPTGLDALRKNFEKFVRKK